MDSGEQLALFLLVLLAADRARARRTVEEER
jgi:hypothetical protein